MKKPIFSPTALLGTGIGILGIGLTLVLPEKFPPTLIPYDSELRAGGLGTSLIGGALIVGAVVNWLRDMLTSWYHRSGGVSALAERLIEFDDSYALASDLDEICALGNSVIGDNHATEDILRVRLEKCPYIIKKLTSNNPTKTPIYGYYICYPLTAKGVMRIDRKQVTSGKLLQDADIASSFRNAKAIYISMIFGESLAAKAAALLHLKNDIKHLCDLNREIRKLYAKPSTKDGLRLLRRNSFRPIDTEVGIWMLTL